MVAGFAAVLRITFTGDPGAEKNNSRGVGSWAKTAPARAIRARKRMALRPCNIDWGLTTGFYCDTWSAATEASAMIGRQIFVTILALTIFAQSNGLAHQQPGEAVQKLNIVIVEGERAGNNARQRVARDPMVQVEDENRKPVAGAAVVFSVAEPGSGCEFRQRGSVSDGADR